MEPARRSDGLRPATAKRGCRRIDSTTARSTPRRQNPLNEALDRFDLAGALPDDVERRRAGYEAPWNRWHHARTAAAIASFALTALAALVATDES
jgi:hypothetical protein